MKQRFARLICLFFGAGLARKAPGTVGTLAALPVGFAIHYFLGSGGLLLFSLLAFLTGWWACRVYLAATGKDDPGEVVIDEVAGVWLLLAMLFPTWQSYLAGFLLFRLFDIVKPWPISLADRKIKGAFGTMLDDMLAAFYPLLLLIVCARLSIMMGSTGEWVFHLAQWLSAGSFPPAIGASPL